MSLVLNIPDNGYLLEGLLVDPNGMQLSVAPNQDPINGSPQFALQMSHYNPAAGSLEVRPAAEFHFLGQSDEPAFHGAHRLQFRENLGGRPAELGHRRAVRKRRAGRRAH